jgi:pyruvate formate lyase activating enzyme
MARQARKKLEGFPPASLKKRVTRGTILKIQRFSLQDGPGIRTTVFLKGCALRCKWCSNPESQSGHPEVMYDRVRCIGDCKECLPVCEFISKTDQGSTIQIDRSRCTNCGRCAKVCPTKALHIVGESLSAEEVVLQVERDTCFYRNSGGGVTLSGGEPLFQHEFARDLLRACKERGIHTVLDTSGFAEWTLLEETAEFVDLFLYDLKCMDDTRHREFTGASNRVILENAMRLSRRNSPMIIRIPIIPGMNDGEKDMEQAARFIRGLNSVVGVDLLPYHRLGASKYPSLGRRYALEHVGLTNKEHMARVRNSLRSLGIDASVIV